MITHNMLVGAVFRVDLLDAWCGGCLNSELSCRKCCDKMITEYEDSIRKEAVRKFAEWFAKCSKVSEPVLEHTVNRWIEDYEQEMKNDNA